MKKIKITSKTVFTAFKISAGCFLTMLAALALGLKYSPTAGLITVLSIQDTKRETVITALKRLSAFFVAVFIAFVCFNLMGYNALSFGVYLFIFTLLCNLLEWKSAIVPISVLVTHLLGEKSTEISLLLNEFLIFLIGAGGGTLLNMHLHRDTEKMRKRREMLDNEIKAILERMSQRILKDDKSDYNGECFRKIDKLMFEAQSVAFKNRDNVLKNTESYDIEYLEMRKNQCNVLYEMYKSILRISVTPEQAVVISDFLRKTSAEYHESNDVAALKEELDRIFSEMRFQKMPVSREEFENRAVLYSFMLQLREFLSFKYEFMLKKR